MTQARQDSRDQKIAALKAQVLELQAKLAALTASELSLMEDGLRLSQENEVLRKELASLKRPRK
jgi:hypothetical protein